MCPDKKRPAGNTCRIAKGLDAVWAHFCPSKPCLPLSTDGIITNYDPRKACWQLTLESLLDGDNDTRYELMHEPERPIKTTIKENEGGIVL